MSLSANGARCPIKGKRTTRGAQRKQAAGGLWSIGSAEFPVGPDFNGQALPGIAGLELSVRFAPDAGRSGGGCRKP